MNSRSGCISGPEHIAATCHDAGLTGHLWPWTHRCNMPRRRLDWTSLALNTSLNMTQRRLDISGPEQHCCNMTRRRLDWTSLSLNTSLQHATTNAAFSIAPSPCPCPTMRQHDEASAWEHQNSSVNFIRNWQEIDRFVPPYSDNSTLIILHLVDLSVGTDQQ